MVTFPDRIPLKIAIASECDKPWVEWPFTDKISSPGKKFEKKEQAIIRTNRYTMKKECCKIYVYDFVLHIFRVVTHTKKKE